MARRQVERLILPTLVFILVDTPLLRKVQPLLNRCGDRSAFLASGLSEEETAQMRSHERTGRPLGSPALADRLERILRRVLKPRKRGPKPGTKRHSSGGRTEGPTQVWCPQILR